MGQVGSLLPGNEAPEVQDWLLRSKGAERRMREGGKKERRPGGHKGTGERPGQVKRENGKWSRLGGRGAFAPVKPQRQSKTNSSVFSRLCLRCRRTGGEPDSSGS